MPGEKSEKATPKRRSDERKKGNVFQSKDINSVATLVVMFLGLSMLLPNMLQSLQRLFLSVLSQGESTQVMSIAFAQMILSDALYVFLILTLPLVIIGVVVNVAATLLQTRFVFSYDVIKFKFERIDIIKGFGKLFSLKSVFELVKSTFKIIMLGLVLYFVISPRFDALERLMDFQTHQVIVLTGQVILNMVWVVGAVFAFIALIDYGYQWYEHEKNLKMSKQDIKDEYKQLEGDPFIKGKIKDRQRQMAQRRMMQDVPKADVIIRNPTHIAIAMKYDKTVDNAPKVIAKGLDAIALKIITIAQANAIETVEDKPLAKALYDAVEIGDTIPEEFYSAIAQILALVYKAKEEQIKR